MAARSDVRAGLARRVRIAALASLAGVFAGTAFGYDQPTHVVLSQQAFDESIMDLVSFEYGIGAFDINNDGSITFQKYSDTTGVNWDLYALVQDGSWLEDDGLRSLNHFFNPVNNTPLISDAVVSTYSSPDWALAPVGSINNAVFDQTNSFEDARNYEWTALTSADPSLRFVNLGLMYQSLGQVIHHLEDMAQPQHARDEAHCDQNWGCKVPGAAFGLYHPSAYEEYMRVCTETPSVNCPPISGNYPAVFDQTNPNTYNKFPVPRDFWTESTQGNNGSPSYGLAEFTNSGFVGARTNFRGTPTAILPADPAALPLPNGDAAVPSQQSTTSTFLWGGTFPITATMTFISTKVTDEYTLTTTTNPMTSAYSVYTFDLFGRGLGGAFSLNDATYASAASFLIPRAIGYSAGLLNYFFRGQIGVSLPNEGVYGIIDQSQQYGAGYTTDVTGNTEGFKVIKVALTNTSPDGEPMAHGTLAAILRYRRNTNYVDTLAGEAGAPAGDLAIDRGTSDEYVVSGTVKDASGNVLSPGQVQLSTTSAQEFEFDFPQALPLNSTDVYLQIIFKGDVGQETKTAVVSTMVDLSEPTYVSIFNSLDYISVNGSYYTRSQFIGNTPLLNAVQPQSCVDRNVTPNQLMASCFSDTENVPIGLDSQNTGLSQQSLVYLQQLPVDAYTRVAVLTNAFGSNANVAFNFASLCQPGPFSVNALNDEIAITSPPTATLQSAIQETGYASTLYSFRGILGWFDLYCVWDGDGSAQSTGDPSVMTALSGADIYPYPVKVNFPEAGY